MNSRCGDTVPCGMAGIGFNLGGHGHVAVETALANAGGKMRSDDF